MQKAMEQKRTCVDSRGERKSVQDKCVAFWANILIQNRNDHDYFLINYFTPTVLIDAYEPLMPKEQKTELVSIFR